MVLYMFVGSLLPYIEGLDSWLFEGTLDDPSNEVIIIEFPNLLSWREKRSLTHFFNTESPHKNNSRISLNLSN